MSALADSEFDIPQEVLNGRAEEDNLPFPNSHPSRGSGRFRCAEKIMTLAGNNTTLGGSSWTLLLALGSGLIAAALILYVISAAKKMTRPTELSSSGNRLNAPVLRIDVTPRTDKPRNYGQNGEDAYSFGDIDGLFDVARTSSKGAARSNRLGSTTLKNLLALALPSHKTLDGPSNSWLESVLADEPIGIIPNIPPTDHFGEFFFSFDSPVAWAAVSLSGGKNSELSVPADALPQMTTSASDLQQHPVSKTPGVYDYAPESPGGPEPATFGLLGSALMGLGLLGRKRLKRDG